MAISTSNLSALTPLTTTATALSNLILVSPQAAIGYQAQNLLDSNGNPSNQQQDPAFLFHYEGEQSMQLESDITDHFIEDNTALQDQIALKPPVINTHGFIGELNNVIPKNTTAYYAKIAADKLTLISAYTPQLSISALLAYNTAFQLYQTADNAKNSAVSAWSSVKDTSDPKNPAGSQTQTKQQIAFQILYGYWSQRRLFTIQTPWGVFNNMAIKSMRPVQGGDDLSITDFEMSFKQIRIAMPSTFSGTIGAFQQGRAVNQSQSQVNNGTKTPVASTSLVSSLRTQYALPVVGP